MKKILSKILSLFTFLAVILLVEACRLEDETLNTSAGIRLSFSKDTVFFDTIFTDLKSITRRVTVYNPSKNAVEITNIRLGKGAISPYSLIINGEETNQKDRIKLLGKDSLLILITAKLGENRQNIATLVRDSILFTTNSNTQHIKLWAWGQDAIRQSSIRITQPTIWTNNKPYIVADSLIIFENGSLTIEAGTTVYMNLNAKMILQGKLTINGTCDKPVRILGIRNDEGYADLAGQWQGIFFTVDSKGADINYAEIKNADIGLRIAIFDNNNVPDVMVRNTKIQNMSIAGILAVDSDILLQNVLINNCFQRSFDVLRGGNYTLQHCTFTNFERSPSQKTATVRLQNFVLLTNSQTMMQTIEAAPLNFTLENSIVWGTFAEEFFIDNRGNANSTIRMNNNLLRTANLTMYGTNNFTAPNNQDFSNAALRYVNFKWQNSRYKGREIFSLDSLSPAIDKGKLLNINSDIICTPRDAKPDLGAYEWKR